MGPYRVEQNSLGDRWIIVDKPNGLAQATIPARMSKGYAQEWANRLNVAYAAGAQAQADRVKQLEEALRGEYSTWWNNLSEALEWCAEKREAQAKREDCLECAAPRLRELASKVRAALKGGEDE